MIWGSNPFGFHISVYLSHAISTLLLYLSLILLLRMYQKEETIALLTASLFAVHPIHAEAVAWIAGRSDTFMTMFILVALYTFLRFRLGAPSWATLPFFALGCILSLLSKETAIPFLVIFPATDFLLHRSGVLKWKRMKDPVIWILVVLLGSFICYRFFRVGFPPLTAGETISPGNGITTLLVSFGYYLKLLLVPHPLNEFVSELPSGALGRIYLMFGLVGFLGLAWVMVRWNRTLFAVGAVWFALGLIAPLAVPFTNASVTPVAERYAYLASGGFFLMAGSGIFEGWRLIQNLPDARINAKWATSGIIIMIGLFSYLTFERNAVWRDEKSLWEDAAQKSPASGIAHNNLGSAYRQLGRAEDAVREYQIALKLKPDYAPANYNLGNIYAIQGRYGEAIKAYSAALKVQPESVATHFNLATAYEDQGSLAEAIEEYQMVIKLNPDFPVINYTLGNAYFKLHREEEAAKAYLAALKFKPDFPEAHFNLGNVYVLQGRTEEAIHAYQAALKLRPDYAKAHYKLGNVYAKQGQMETALGEYKMAIGIQPDFADAHNNLGNTYLIQNKLDEAIQEYQTAIKLQPDLVEAHINLGQIFKKTGRLTEAKSEFNAALKTKPDYVAARKALESLPNQK